MDYLILTDKFNPISNDFYDDLELILIGDKLIEKNTGKQLKKMLAAAKQDYIELKIISAFRTIPYQQKLWEESVNSQLAKGLSYEQANFVVGKTLALPGCSEHNTGLAIDFGRENADDVEEDFYKSAQAKWLSENASRFGFILRYPRLKEHITGIDYEPWHYRYVGREIAEIIKQSGICFEEFLHFYGNDFCKSD